MESVYEVRDVTNEEVYYPLALFADLDKAKAFCTKATNTDSPPHSEWTELDYWNCIELEIKERRLNMWSENSKTVASFKWTATYDDDGEPDWSYGEK
jgi:hypothetical protein